MMQKTLLIIGRQSQHQEPPRARAWLATAAGTAFLTLMTVSYMEGSIAESMRRDRDVQQQINAALSEKEALQARYDLLADSSGEAAILEAGIRYQEQQEAQK